MNRSLYKSIYVPSHIVKLGLRESNKAAIPLSSSPKVEKSKDTVEITIFSRSTRIVPFFLGKSCRVYNGKRFFTLEPTESHLGFCFGEFSPTRKNFKPKMKQQKNIIKKKK